MIHVKSYLHNIRCSCVCRAARCLFVRCERILCATIMVVRFATRKAFSVICVLSKLLHIVSIVPTRIGFGYSLATDINRLVTINVGQTACKANCCYVITSHLRCSVIIFRASHYRCVYPNSTIRSLALLAHYPCRARGVIGGS